MTHLLKGKYLVKGRLAAAVVIVGGVFVYLWGTFLHFEFAILHCFDSKQSDMNIQNKTLY